MERNLSAASKRASNYPNQDDSWLCTFQYMSAPGLGLEEGVHRRDPSSIILVDGKYYVWYTKSVGPQVYGAKGKYNDWKIFPWDFADIFYATSEDGINWKEEGCAVHRGVRGSYDDRTVCTPEILAHEGKYYLVYQTMSWDTAYLGSNEKVGMSVADSPNGPWNKIDKPILEPEPKSDLFQEANSYNTGDFLGLVHDPLLLYYQNKFYLYYKNCGLVDSNNAVIKRYAGRDNRWGVAISDNVEGPYVPSEYNPVTNSGHETLLWLYDGGVAALLNRDGPEKNTLQYAKDGINFEIMSHTQDTPQAGGAFRCEDTHSNPLAGIRWGLCHVDERASTWNYIFRFDTLPLSPDIFPHNYPPGK